uniref:AAA family ATPase n=1 Tax=Pararhizobium sp. IMCC3301 TaxID=3067904 RepID=UPI0027414C3A|nr:AAA family ATPase [Pararhizobium sp. IMCC3301]
MLKTTASEKWGLLEKPNFGHINFSDTKHLSDLLFDQADLERIRSQIRTAHKLKKQSITCLTGPSGSGKSTLSNTLALFNDDFHVIDFLDISDKYKNDHDSANFIWKVCSLFSEYIENNGCGDTTNYLSNVLASKSRIKTISDETQFINYLIEEFSSICGIKNNFEIIHGTYIIDNLDKLDVFQFKHVLNLFGSLGHNLTNWNFCIIVSPELRLAMRQSEYRGELTDIVAIDGDRSLKISTDSVISKRFQTKSIEHYLGPRLMEQSSYRIIESFSNKNKALFYIDKVYDYAINSTYSGTIPYDLVFGIVSNNDNKELNMYNDTVGLESEFNFRALEDEIKKAGIDSKGAKEMLRLLKESQVFNNYIKTCESMEDGLISASFDFR